MWVVIDICFTFRSLLACFTYFYNIFSLSFYFILNFIFFLTCAWAAKLPQLPIALLSPKRWFAFFHIAFTLNPPAFSMDRCICSMYFNINAGVDQEWNGDWLCHHPGTSQCTSIYERYSDHHVRVKREPSPIQYF